MPLLCLLRAYPAAPLLHTPAVAVLVLVLSLHAFGLAHAVACVGG
jgi:hypothetical protein